MRCQALIAFVLACCGNSASAQIQWGVNGHPITAYPGISIDDQLDLVQDLGMTSYRVNVSEVDQSDHLAAILQAARERDIVILPVLTPGGLDLDNDAPETTYKKAHDFAFALGDRFRDQVLVWELGNEEENYAIIQPCEFRDDGTQYPCDWGPAGGVEPLAVPRSTLAPGQRHPSRPFRRAGGCSSRNPQGHGNSRMGPCRSLRAHAGRRDRLGYQRLAHVRRRCRMGLRAP